MEMVPSKSSTYKLDGLLSCLTDKDPVNQSTNTSTKNPLTLACISTNQIRDPSFVNCNEVEIASGTTLDLN